VKDWDERRGGPGVMDFDVTRYSNGREVRVHGKKLVTF
jgi:hypothetical protein